MNILQQIFSDHYEEIKYTLKTRPVVLESINKMIHCGDPAYGGAMYGCPSCGALKFVPFRSLVGDSPFLSPSPLILFVVLAVTLWSSYSLNSKRLRLTISLERFCPIPRTHSSLGFRLA